MLLISELKLKLNEDEQILNKLVCLKLHIKQENLLSLQIYKKSLDARKEPIYKYQVLVEINDKETKYLGIKNVKKYASSNTSVTKIQSNTKPIVIGYGPAGIFATYRLVEAGLKPIVIEKGKRITERVKDVELFFKEGILNPSSNVQFGEGGAGTFSDAKLTTRIKDPFVDYILEVFIKFGAKESIKYTPHAHIGTDQIRLIIQNITNYLIEQGCEFHFEEELLNLKLNENHEISGIQTNKADYYSSCVLLGIGHSAYQTIKALFKQGVAINPKDLAIGFRVEHPQSLIDQNQLGDKKPLEASEYFLRYKDEKGVYSFCMCPGGIVIPAASDIGRIVTNGMSNSLRNSGIANSAILIQVSQEEFPPGALGGFEYLKTYEEKAFNISGSYKALAANLKDYINNSQNPLIFPSTYPLGTELADFNQFFKESDNAIFKKALLYFESKIPGFIKQGIMVGPETRSSSPVRINRNLSLESSNTPGLFPMGEGAGYGGGIMSCALDGIKIANIIIKKLTNNSR